MPIVWNSTQKIKDYSQWGIKTAKSEYLNYRVVFPRNIMDTLCIYDLLTYIFIIILLKNNIYVSWKTQHKNINLEIEKNWRTWWWIQEISGLFLPTCDQIHIVEKKSFY